MKGEQRPERVPSSGMALSAHAGAVEASIRGLYVIYSRAAVPLDDSHLARNEGQFGQCCRLFHCYSLCGCGDRVVVPTDTATTNCTDNGGRTWR